MIPLLISSKEMMKVNIILFPIILSFFAYAVGWRDIGVDTDAYKTIFDSVGNFSFDLFPAKYIAAVEVGFHDLIFLAKSIGLNFSEFSLFYYLLCTFVLFWGVLKLVNMEQAILFWLISIATYTSYQIDFNQIRQGLTGAFFILALAYALKKQYIRFLITIYIASLFHSTVLIAIILPILIWISLKFSRKFFLFILCLLPLVITFVDITVYIKVFADILGTDILNKISYYLNDPEFNTRSPINVTLLLSYLGLFILYYFSIRTMKNNYMFNLLTRLTILGYLIYSCCFNFMVIAQRLLYYTDLLYILCWAVLLYNSRKKTIMLISASVFLLLYSMKTLFSSVNWG